VRVVGVLDLQGGRVVRGVAGRRHEYRPVVSRLTPSCSPRDVARAFRDHLGLSELYLADLDAIGGSPPDWDVYAALRAEGFRLWVDAGVRGAAQMIDLAARGIDSVVAGLETLSGPAALAPAVQALGERLVFSLDLQDGAPLGDHAAWGADAAAAVAERAVALGVTRLLVLDLTRVGVGSGLGTEALCASLAASHPRVEIGAGGGVRGRPDLVRLRGLGVRAVLVASALHDAALGRADLAGLCG
jgi:phosphoribosylformimino-5-aminoimidazole carboxamide ribotide isomerase